MNQKKLFLAFLFLLLEQTEIFCQKREIQNLDVSWNNVSEEIINQTNSITNLIDTIASISHDTIDLKEERISMQDFKTFLSNISKIDKDTLGIANQKLHMLRLTRGKVFILIENQKLSSHKSIKSLCINIYGTTNRITVLKDYFNQACQNNKTGFYFRSDEYFSAPPVERN